MPKMTLTVEVSDAHELFEFIETFNTSFLNVIEEHSLIASPTIKTALNAISGHAALTEPEPEPEPAPAPAPRSHKKTRNASPAPTPPEPAPSVPEPQPPVAAQAPAAPAPERELPSLDALKALVTAAVRAAQKKEGPTTILDLLPAFKAKTKLDFVMNAKDEHRQALADLIEGAGLALEPAQ